MTKAEEKKKTKNTNNKNSLPIKYIFKIWICEKKKKSIKIYTLLANLKLKRERTNKPKEKLLGW